MRELGNTIHRGVVLGRTARVELADLPPTVEQAVSGRAAGAGGVAGAGAAGSAALAAGGAVVFPTADVLQLTPICPHTLSNRSLILPSNSKISVQVVNPTPTTILSADGQVVTELSAGDQIIIRRSRRAVSLMHLEDSSFFETLRVKLHWRGANL